MAIKNIEPPAGVIKTSISKFILYAVAIAIPAVVGGGLVLHHKAAPPPSTTQVQSSNQDLSKDVQQKAQVLSSDLFQQAKQTGEAVLGQATSFVQEKASDSANAAQKYVFHTAAESIAAQIEKLPENQKEELKKSLCK